MPDSEQKLARRLLSLCAPAPQPRPAPPAGEHTQDWDALIQFAIRQGVAPLLAVRTRHLVLPVAFRERLESIYTANSARNLRLAAEESRVCAALAAEGVRHWPLKGPGLSEHLYADIGVRQVSDLDFLVEPANLARADALLAGLGYRRQSAGAIASLSRAQQLLYVHSAASSGASQAVVSRSPFAADIYLDLHQRLLPYVRRDPLATGVFADGMTSENLLLYLCANQVTHRFARLRDVCDVAAFLTREGDAVNWDRFGQTARQMPWAPGVGLALDWAGRFVPGRVPAEVVRKLRPTGLNELLLRHALGADAAEAASRSHLLDGPAGAPVAVGAASLGPAQFGIAWRLAFPSQAYLQEQTGATAGQPLATVYAMRLVEKIPHALRQLFRTAR